MNLAQSVTGGGKIENPALSPALQGLSGVEFFNNLLPKLIGIAIVAGAILFFFQLALGALGWMTSSGDKGKLEAARNKITHAIIGLVILFSIYAIAKIIEWFTGFDVIHLNLGFITL